MSGLLGVDDLVNLAPLGYFMALRIGFAFPIEEVNELPSDWVAHYTQARLMLHDPVIRWAYAQTGAIRWADLAADDPKRVLMQARSFGLRHGVTISVLDHDKRAQRSFASFVRGDREFTDLEMKLLQAYVTRRHHETAPPTNLTRAELEVLGMIKEGKRLKEIAHQLGVSEGAVKLRLKNAKAKLGARTGPQAAALANQYGLI